MSSSDFFSTLIKPTQSQNKNYWYLFYLGESSSYIPILPFVLKNQISFFFLIKSKISFFPQILIFWFFTVWYKNIPLFLFFAGEKKLNVKTKRMQTCFKKTKCTLQFRKRECTPANKVVISFLRKHIITQQEKAYSQSLNYWHGLKKNCCQRLILFPEF